MTDNSTSSHFSQSSTNPYIPNFAQIPNTLFDYWMQRVTPEEFKILTVMAYKAQQIGHDPLNNNFDFLSDITGIPIRRVKKSIKSLIEKNLLAKALDEQEQYFILLNMEDTSE